MLNSTEPWTWQLVVRHNGGNIDTERFLTEEAARKHYAVNMERSKRDCLPWPLPERAILLHPDGKRQELFPAVRDLPRWC